MKTRLKFILLSIAIATAFFPLIRFVLMKPYLILIGSIVSALGGILPYGKAVLSERVVAGTGEIAFDLFKYRKTILVDAASIITNLVPLIALVLATPVKWIKRTIGAGIGIGILMISHILAISVILIWQTSPSGESIEGFKIFIDGILIFALPLLYWAVWADKAYQTGLQGIFKS